MEMLKPDPTERDLDPEKPVDFRTRIDRYKERADELRIDPDDWEKKHPGTKPPGVYLGTVHSVKGAEWQDVTVLMPDGVFPFGRYAKPQKDHECPEIPLYSAQEDEESERRLGYVALTRAVENLTIQCPYSAVLRNLPRGSRPPPREAALSKFVNEAGLKLGENVMQEAATGASLNAMKNEAVVVDDVPENTPESGDIIVPADEVEPVLKVAGEDGFELVGSFNYDRKTPRPEPVKVACFVEDPLGPSDTVAVDGEDAWRE
jgi:hypothetical protein